MEAPVNTRAAWSLREGDRVTYDGQVWTVRKNIQHGNCAQIACDGWIECVSWKYLKPAPDEKISKWKKEVPTL